MDDLLTYLFKHAFENRISCALIWKDVNYQSVALPKKKLIVINQNCRNKYELPFIVGHEIGHIMNGDSDSGVAYYCGSPFTSEERKADLYSLELIYDYAASQFSTFNEPGVFIEQYGIPYRMFDDTVKLYERRTDLLFWIYCKRYIIYVKLCK